MSRFCELTYPEIPIDDNVLYMVDEEAKDSVIFVEG